MMRGKSDAIGWDPFVLSIDINNNDTIRSWYHMVFSIHDLREIMEFSLSWIVLFLLQKDVGIGRDMQ